MLFVNLTPGQVNAYTYACEKLQSIVNKMSEARETLQKAAETSFDKYFAKCVYQFASESLQFENEIHSQISCFNCANVEVNEGNYQTKNSKSFAVKNMETICSYLEENYIKPYRQLLKDKYLSNSLKNLINNQLQVLLSSITQLRLFVDVEPGLN